VFVGTGINKLTLNATLMNKNGKMLNDVKIRSEPDSLKNFYEYFLKKSLVVRVQHGTSNGSSMGLTVCLCKELFNIILDIHSSS